MRCRQFGGEPSTEPTRSPDDVTVESSVESDVTPSGPWSIESRVRTTMNALSDERLDESRRNQREPIDTDEVVAGE